MESDTPKVAKEEETQTASSSSLAYLSIKYAQWACEVWRVFSLLMILPVILLLRCGLRRELTRLGWSKLVGRITPIGLVSKALALALPLPGKRKLIDRKNPQRRRTTRPIDLSRRQAAKKDLERKNMKGFLIHLVTYFFFQTRCNENLNAFEEGGEKKTCVCYLFSRWRQNVKKKVLEKKKFFGAFTSVSSSRIFTCFWI